MSATVRNGSVAGAASCAVPGLVAVIATLLPGSSTATVNSTAPVNPNHRGGAGTGVVTL